MHSYVSRACRQVSWGADMPLQTALRRVNIKVICCMSHKRRYVMKSCRAVNLYVLWVSAGICSGHDLKESSF